MPKGLTKEDQRGSDTNSESENSNSSDGGKDPANDKPLCNAWKFCQKWSKSVEVLYKNMNGHQILTKVHFHYNPEVLNYLHYELEL